MPVTQPLPMIMSPATQNLDLTRGVLKLSVNALEEFTGHLLEFETWQMKTEAILGQTVYGKLLDHAHLITDPVMIVWNKELYNMLLMALMKGSGMHIINKTANQDGHQAWIDSKSRYGSVATSRLISITIALNWNLYIWIIKTKLASMSTILLFVANAWRTKQRLHS